MKRTAAIIAIVALTAVSAMAYQGGFRGQGGGSYGGHGYGMMGGGFGGMGAGAPCYGLNGQPANPVDDAGAKTIVQDYLDANLKGFTIADIVKFETPRGGMYTVEVKDNNGNLFVFRVNPFGRLMGPIPAKTVK
ncbi:conserved hypothetical protein [Denitrovibrio acetiphilus DSM 12809]|jgi:hypothetical protein|uniref:PepSY domain-containing protein n=1 Tax=Denitrovibrio acetiphilus (strain DSM 12809 / NBRC 114555 / N2460) TaxID=522772 RepID=D4H6M3_DENA2|nr:hypothetical protein [Denitrovibrio acetiphilus]ADD69697.1 conserved hypothetical protein [Denitrovibrio acetiphilus DSM 12809]